MLFDRHSFWAAVFVNSDQIEINLYYYYVFVFLMRNV